MVRSFSILVSLAWFSLPAQAEEIEWKTSDGRFSFWQPREPDFKKVDAQPPALQAWESKDGKIKVVMTESPFPSDRMLTLDEAAEGLAKELNGTVVKKESRKSIAADVHTITVEARSNEQDLYVVQVMAAVDGKVYSVRATETGANPLDKSNIVQMSLTAHIYTRDGKKNVFPGSEPPKSISYRMGQIAGGCLLLALVLAVVFKVTGLGKKKKKKKSRDDDDDDDEKEDDPPRRRRKRKADDGEAD